jgi:predicted acetyltransferase
VNDYTSVPLDPESQVALASNGLELALLDNTDPAAARRWLLADAQGFHDPAPSDERLDAEIRDLGEDRITGVWDRSAAEPDKPVATVRVWVMDLTVPGGATLPAWAISSVTVAPTHRRRGVARALLGAELRSARRAGVAMAMLTVSEATIYGRYGFGPAAHQAHYSVDTSRSRWTGPVPRGRVQLIDPEHLLPLAPAIFERARRTTPGEVDRRHDLWRKLLGLYPTAHGEQKGDRHAVRYDDENGDPQGFAVYRFVHENGGYPGRLELSDLVAATDNAYAALWRYLLEMDLISEVRAPLRSAAESVRWQVADHRAVRKTDERDHLWLRILDVPAALEQRSYSAPGMFVLTVDDELGFIGGEYVLTVDVDGRGMVRPLTTQGATGTVTGASDASGASRESGNTSASIADIRYGATDAARLSLSAADLATLYLGGTGAVQLARAGRITEQTTDAAARLDATFHSGHTPWLSTWF